MPETRRYAAVAALFLTSITVSACADEPRPAPRESDRIAITVSVDGDRFEQQALGEVVAHAFVRRGRESYVEVESQQRSRIDRLEEGRVELVLGCTGELLSQLNPPLAAEMSRNYVADKQAGKIDPNDDEWRDDVYNAMVGSLPESLSATDPSNATGCKDYGGQELPQNLVPIFREVALNRQDRITLNDISGAITNKDLQKLYDGPRDQAAVTARANELLDEIGF